jgi:alkylhydroperoxidase family enzyme
MWKSFSLSVQLALCLIPATLAQSTLAQSTAEPSTVSDRPKIIPNTRSETKQALNRLKQREPRLPVPAEVPPNAPAASPSTPGSQTSNVINGRARRFYLPEAWLKSERLGSESKAYLPYELKTQCFWVVSRGNNCHYCLGHQEHKLKLAGFDDDQIGSLDRDWQRLEPRTRKALELARKMTLLPFAMSDRDIATLRADYSESEMVELVYTISRFNSMNRWTDSVGLSQDDVMKGEAVDFESATEDRWNQGESLASPDASIIRPAAWSLAEIQLRIEAARSRTARVALPSTDVARDKLELPEGSQVNDWHRALADLATTGPDMVKAWTTMLDDQELDPNLKGAILWTTGRNNHAPVSLAMAKAHLTRLGWTEAKLEGLTSEPDTLDSEMALVVAFAEKLTTRPTQITDKDISGLRQSFSDRQVAHIIYVTSVANAMDRFTETLGLSTAGLIETDTSSSIGGK